MDREFRVGAEVTCSDGKAGHLRQLVLDPATEAVTHLVVDSQQHFGIPVLVPRDKVASADEQEVRLNCSQAQLRQMDPFEEVMYSPAPAGPGAAPGVPPNYLFPAAGLGVQSFAGLVGPLASPPTPAPVVEEVVPTGEVVINRESTVEASDGEVGHVEDVGTDPASGKLTHLVVRSGHLWAAHSFRLPASAIEKVEEGTVRLRLSKAEVESVARSGEAAPATGETAAAYPAGEPVRVAKPPAPSASEQRTAEGATGGGQHVAGLFATREQAEDAIDTLMAAGFPSDAMSAITKEGQTVSFPTAGEEQVDRGGRNAAIGAVVGAIAGFAIFGPLLLLFGAVAGGLVGLLTSIGASREQAEYLTERVRAGHYLVVVRADGREPEAISQLENAGAADVRQMA